MANSIDSIFPHSMFMAGLYPSLDEIPDVPATPIDWDEWSEETECLANLLLDRMSNVSEEWHGWYHDAAVQYLEETFAEGISGFEWYLRATELCGGRPTSPFELALAKYNIACTHSRLRKEG